MFFQIDIDGSLKITTDAVTASSFHNAGLAYNAAGALHVTDAGTSLSGQFYTRGMATTAQGALYTTSDTPAASAVSNGGILCRADGAVYVASSGGTFANGMPVDSLGRLFANVSPLNSSAFFAPLTHSLTLTRGTGSATFTRASTAYVLGYAASAVIADGPTLILCASGEARFVGARRISEGNWARTDANGVDLTTTNGASSLCCDASGPLGYQAEPAATNLCLQSQTFGTTWAKETAGDTVTANTTIAPDGTTTADTFTADGTNAVHALYQTAVPVSGATQTHSLYVKKGTADFIYVLALGAGGSNCFFAQVFDISGVGALGESKVGTTSGTVSGATITALTGGWFRISVTGVFTQTNPVLEVGIAPAATGNTWSVYGVITLTTSATVILWGGQTETGSVATSYIPTTTAAVTRAADALTYGLTGNISATAGTVYAEVQDYVFNGNANGYIHFGLSSTGVALYNSGAAKNLKMYDGTNIDQVTLTNTTIGSVSKIASSWNASLSSMSITGQGMTPVSGTFDGNLGVGSATINIGGSGAVLSSITPKNIRNVRIWTTALTDAQLVTITTP